MAPTSAKKRPLGCPWAPPGLHKREEEVQTHSGEGSWRHGVLTGSILGSSGDPLGEPWAATEEQKHAQERKKA